MKIGLYIQEFNTPTQYLGLLFRGLIVRFGHAKFSTQLTDSIFIYIYSLGVLIFDTEFKFFSLICFGILRLSFDETKISCISN